MSQLGIWAMASEASALGLAGRYTEAAALQARADAAEEEILWGPSSTVAGLRAKARDLERLLDGAEPVDTPMLDLYRALRYRVEGAAHERAMGWDQPDWWKPKTQRSRWRRLVRR